MQALGQQTTHGTHAANHGRADQPVRSPLNELDQTHHTSPSTRRAKTHTRARARFGCHATGPGYAGILELYKFD